MTDLDGGPHELSRRCGISSYNIGSMLLGREDLSDDLYRSMCEAINTPAELEGPSISELRWIHFTRVLEDEFQDDLRKMARVLGLELAHLRAVFIGTKRISGELARTIEERLALDANSLDMAEDHHRASGLMLPRVRRVNILMHLMHRYETAEQAIAQHPEALPSGVQPALFKAYEATPRKDIAHQGTKPLLSTLGEDAAEFCLGYTKARMLENELGMPRLWFDHYLPPIASSKSEFGG